MYNIISGSLMISSLNLKIFASLKYNPALDLDALYQDGGVYVYPFPASVCESHYLYR